ncbi:cell division protein FtsL [Halocynthiibacter namhaensis]|uniref:cell division protein FtsL n=1 Tax=Halocynthiibacter namhaensis TaxID=1290553 RepID=UPI00057959B5|nr:cell division protein FtsL [Halocynthiibacter namhaensis]
MRSFMFLVTGLVVMGLAFWAYRENYRTQEVTREIRSLHLEIAEARGALSILNAEWAYLNRPDRLRELAELNFDSLGLLPLTGAHYVRVDQVAWPAPVTLLDQVEAPVETMGVLLDASAGGDSQ